MSFFFFQRYGSDGCWKEHCEQKSFFFGHGCTDICPAQFIQTANPTEDTNQEIGHGLESCTSQITASRVSFTDGTNVVLVDTPGFDDTYLSDFDILESVAKWLKHVYVASFILFTLSANLFLDELVNWKSRGYSIYTVSPITEWQIPH
jgi:hypothetical protein